MRNLILATAMLFAANVTGGVAAENPFPLQCAARDAEMLTLIEQNGTAQTMPGEQVASAFLRLMDARSACRTEGAGAGLARYEAVFPTSEVSASRK